MNVSDLRASISRISESKIGFWIITTSIVGAATTANAYFQTYFSTRQLQTTQIERLELEYEFRLTQYLTAIERLSTSTKESATWKPEYSADDAKQLTRILVGTPAIYKDFPIYSVYPKEYGQSPLAGILAELAVLRPEKASRYRAAINTLASGQLLEMDHSAPYRVAVQVNSTLIHKLAPGAFLFYMDCSPVNPFC